MMLRSMFAAMFAATIVPASLHARPVTVEVRLHDGIVTLSQPHGRTVIRLRQHHSNPSEVVLPADSGITWRTIESARLVSEPDAATIILETTYESQTGVGGPQVQCAAGRETVLRVIRLVPNLRQTASTLTESCWQNINFGTASWDRQSRTLHFLEDSSIAFQLSADGRLLTTSR